MAKKDDKHDGGFSFDRDPGSLQESGELDFTFSDVPVLGQDAKLKEKFSFDHKPESPRAAQDAQDAALASFEQMLRESPPTNSGEESGPPSDVSHGIDEGFLLEQRERWQRKVQQAFRQRSLAITTKLAYVLGPLLVLAGLIYLATSLWFRYQAEEDAKRNYVSPPKRPLMDRRETDEARKLKEAMERALAEADEAVTKGEPGRAVAIYRDLAPRGFFKAGFLQPRLGRALARLGETDAALAAYREAIAAGPMEAGVFAEAASLLNKAGQYAESTEALKTGLAAFPEDASLHAMLAETSYAQGDAATALASFKNLKRGDMSEHQLDIYGRLLVAGGQRDEARKVFFFSAKRFNSFPAYLAATEMADRPQDRIEVMAHASGALADARERNTALTVLAKHLHEAGKTEEAKKQLAMVNPAQMLAAHVPGFLETCFQVGMTEEQVSEVMGRIHQGFPDSLAVHMAIQDVLVEVRQPSLMLRLYGEWWATSPGSASANYLYGRALKTGPDALERFAKATQLDADMVEAWQALADLHFMAKRWAQAEQAYAAWVRLRPDDGEARYRLALVNLYAGHGAESIEDYARYLQTTTMPERGQVLRLLDLAQRLPTPDLAERYLARLRAMPGTAEEARVQELRTKLFFGRLTDQDFADVVPRRAREIQQLHLLARGKLREVLMMPTPPEEFPEFWKVFLCRLSDIEWQDNAERLIDRHRGSADPTVTILGNLWLGRIPLDEARAMNDRIPPDQEPLFYFILAEEYRRQNNAVGAKICYTRALAGRPNPLTRVIEHFNRPRRGF
jgi:tetratricopeptide (TPR) repeat protein